MFSGERELFSSYLLISWPISSRKRCDEDLNLEISHRFRGFRVHLLNKNVELLLPVKTLSLFLVAGRTRARADD